LFLLLKTQSLIAAIKSRKRKNERQGKLRDKREQESIAITWLTEKAAKILRNVIKDVFIVHRGVRKAR